MILTDREIKLALKKKLIAIDPAPATNAYASTSVDLTLDPLLRIFRNTGAGVIIDPGLPGYQVKQLLLGVTDPFTIPADGWDFARGTLILGWTKERVELNLKAKLAARVEGKSSLARLGLGIHITAPTIHAGFVGTIQLEMINHGPSHIKLRPHMPICQLIFEMTKGVPEKAYKGQFSGHRRQVNLNFLFPLLNYPGVLRNALPTQRKIVKA
jgi:dCTP deaminase